jgi:hypothetical protein
VTEQTRKLTRSEAVLASGHPPTEDVPASRPSKRRKFSDFFSQWKGIDTPLLIYLKGDGSSG